jgi:bifunctional DNA-binding transcriptional regulator/antitoxin component of YhaV-PrlF toxin-antitoxin module
MTDGGDDVYGEGLSQRMGVIPKPLREKYGLEKGTRVHVVDYGDVLALMPLPADPVGALHGMLGGDPPLTEELLSERARERAMEEERGG